MFDNTAFFLLLRRRIAGFKPPIAILEVSPRGWRPRNLSLDYVIPRADLILTVTEAQARYVQATWKVRHAPVDVGCMIDEHYFAPAAAAVDKDYVLSVGEDFSRDYSTLIQDLRALYAGARAVAVPMVVTNNPGGISTLLEAMAMGRPIVASETATSRELLIDAVSGLLVPPQNPLALRAALASIMADATLAARLGEAARQQVELNHGMKRRQSRLATALRRFCAERVRQSGPSRLPRRPREPSNPR